jgi:predicted HNH restriction endonuclease
MSKSNKILRARRSPRLAGDIFRRIVPEAFFLAVLKAVAYSIKLAHRAAPSKWGLRLNPKGIMLKVGFVEVLQIKIDGWVRFHELVHRDLVPQIIRADRRFLVGRAPYVNAPNCDTYDMDLVRAARAYAMLLPAHEAAIRTAACSQRRVDTARDHSPGLVAFILRELGSAVVQPSYAAHSSTDAFYLPEEVLGDAEFSEGAAIGVQVNRYERDAVAREYCIKHYGTTCVVCRRSLADQYGPQVIGLIHVHHLMPLGTVRKRVRVDPIRHLRPVCPNCHAVIHSTNPPRSIDEVYGMMLRTCRVRRAHRRR